MSSRSPQHSQQTAGQSSKRRRKPWGKFQSNSLPSSSQRTDVPDDGSDRLSELDSTDVHDPAGLQYTNDDSLEVLQDVPPVSQTPFSYSWVRWEDPGLDGMVRPSRQSKTRAWWWKYGVPLEKIVSSKDGREKRERRLSPFPLWVR